MPDPEIRILCVDNDDTARGPIAMVLLRRLLKTLNTNVVVESAGHNSDLRRGAPVTRDAGEELVDWGLGREISCHKSRHFSDVPGLYAFNHYLVLDKTAKDVLVDMRIRPEDITILGEEEGGVGNPSNKGAGEYHDCALRINAAVEKFVKALLPAD